MTDSPRKRPAGLGRGLSSLLGEVQQEAPVRLDAEGDSGPTARRNRVLRAVGVWRDRLRPESNGTVSGQGLRPGSALTEELGAAAGLGRGPSGELANSPRFLS